MPSGGVNPTSCRYEATTGTWLPSVTSFSTATPESCSCVASIGPVVDDVVVVGDVDEVDIHGSEFRHFRQQEIGEAFPPGAARVGRGRTPL
jgi:hypothetical protein